MHATSLFATIVAMSAAVSATPLFPRALRKANEFSSGNCAQGTASYEHHSNYNVDVTMDDTSNSVYFASGPWYFYSGKSENGGVCTGDVLGSWENDTDNPCVNLNERPGDSRRIQCVKWNNGIN